MYLLLLLLDFRPRGYNVQGYNDGHGAHPEILNSHDMRVSNQLHPEFEPNVEPVGIYKGELGVEEDRKLTTGPHKNPRDLSKN